MISPQPNCLQQKSQRERSVRVNHSRRAWTPCLVAGVLAVAAFAVSAVAQAQQAFVSHRTNLRAGPDRSYPPVAWVGQGTGIYVYGCVRGYNWCDVSAGAVRGWANARHLGFPYQNRSLALYGNGVAFGVPVVSFALNPYWDTYYRDRPWYSHHGYWSGWRPGITPRVEYYRAPPAYVRAPGYYVAPRPVPRAHPVHPVHPGHPHRGEATRYPANPGNRAYERAAPPFVVSSPR
jgi:uncharacterized protein YraI